MGCGGRRRHPFHIFELFHYLYIIDYRLASSFKGDLDYVETFVQGSGNLTYQSIKNQAILNPDPKSKSVNPI